MSMEDVKCALTVIHTFAVIEALELAKACAVDLTELHTILCGAAGASTVFNEGVCHLSQ